MTIVLGDLLTQPLLYFPLHALDAVSSGTAVEYIQNLKTLELTLVAPRGSGRTRRYKIVRHHGACWTSLPKPWLRYLSPKAGDMLDVVWRDATAPTMATITFRRRDIHAPSNVHDAVNA